MNSIIGRIAQRPRRVETRAAAVTDALDCAARSPRSSGTVDSSALAVVEACAGLWARAFAAAEHDTRACVRARAHRAVHCCLFGECVYPARRLRRGRRPGTCRAAKTWSYRLDLAYPSGTKSVRRDARPACCTSASINRSETPWKGVSPFEKAGLSKTLLACLEQSLRHEYGGPIGHVLPVPSGSTQTDLATDVAAPQGQRRARRDDERPGTGKAARDRRSRIGSRIASARIRRSPRSLLHDANASVALLAAAGVPADIAGGSGRDRIARVVEAVRRSRPSRRSVCMVAEEVSQNKLGSNGGPLTFKTLRAADVQGQRPGLCPRWSRRACR